MKKSDKELANIGLFLLLVLVIAVVTLLIGCQGKQFNQAEWLAARSHSETRSQMARDILYHHLPIGKPKSEVLALLGKPEVDEPLDRDILGHSPGTAVYYGVGYVGPPDIDPDYLRIYFDENNRLTQAFISRL